MLILNNFVQTTFSPCVSFTVRPITDFHMIFGVSLSPLFTHTQATACAGRQRRRDRSAAQGPLPRPLAVQFGHARGRRADVRRACRVSEVRCRENELNSWASIIAAIVIIIFIFATQNQNSSRLLALRNTFTVFRVLNIYFSRL